MFYKSSYTISNLLTVSRLVMAPLIVWEISNEQWLPVFILFVAAALTDFLDGYLARFFNESTRLGTWLDPLADKVLLLSCFIAFAAGSSPAFFIPKWFVIFFIVRELIIVGGAGWLMFRHPGKQMTPTWGGKILTFFQIMFIFWLLICRFFSWQPHKTYGVVLVSLVIIGFLTLMHYIYLGVQYLQKQE